MEAAREMDYNVAIESRYASSFLWIKCTWNNQDDVKNIEVQLKQNPVNRYNSEM